MSVRELKLSQLSLTHPASDLKLSVTASGVFALPLGFPSLDDHELQEALLSGRIWITRGRACRIDMNISFNNRPLDESSRLQVLESLGYQCRDAHVSGLRCVCISY